MKKYVRSASLALFLCLLFAGCERTYSDDLAELREIVEIDMLTSAARWEVFRTPEFSGGVPGPTDFVTLVAEMPGVDPTVFDRRAKSGTVWIAPEAARLWLSGNHRSMLRGFRNTSIDLSKVRNCRAAHGKLKKSGQPVHGFICNNSAKAIIYLTLADFSGS